MVCVWDCYKAEFSGVWYFRDFSCLGVNFSEFWQVLVFDFVPLFVCVNLAVLGILGICTF